MAIVLSYYKNSTMGCEAIGCHYCVARVYHPFCKRCSASLILRGHFLSRDGSIYNYDGHRWVNQGSAVQKSS